jgi:tetratricopeptide (TPR) repeat protein
MPHAAAVPRAVVKFLMALALLAASLGAASAQSDQGQAERARRLDALFAQLKIAKDQDEGDAIVADIWKVWLQSGSAEMDARMEQAVKLMAHGLLPLALGALDEIVAAAPQWAEAWNKRATVLFLLGEHDRSLADIDRVLALEPRHFGALAGIGMIRTDKGELREALAAYRRALAVNPYLKERYGLIPALEKELGVEPL